MYSARAIGALALAVLAGGALAPLTGCGQSPPSTSAPGEQKATETAAPAATGPEADARKARILGNLKLEFPQLDELEDLHLLRVRTINTTYEIAVAGGAPGEILVRGGRYESPEGSPHDRHVIVEFDSFEKAKACYFSPEYQKAVQIRFANASSNFYLVEGAD